MASSGLFIVTALLPIRTWAWTSEISVRPGMTWEEQASYLAYHDRCDLGTTETVKIMIRPRNYVITNCDRKGFNSFRTISYVSKDLNIPGPHNKEWCIRYFRAVGFLPGKSLDWARKTMCDANYFRSGKWRQQDEEQTRGTVASGGSKEYSEDGEETQAASPTVETTGAPTGESSTPTVEPISERTPTITTAEVTGSEESISITTQPTQRLAPSSTSTQEQTSPTQTAQEVTVKPHDPQANDDGEVDVTEEDEVDETEPKVAGTYPMQEIAPANSTRTTPKSSAFTQSTTAVVTVLTLFSVIFPL